MSEFNPNRDAAFAFQSMFSDRNEVSPLGQAGASHFGYVQGLHPGSSDPGWHAVTQVGGLGQKTHVRHYDYLNDMDL